MLSKWETFFLLIMTVPIMGHVVILPLMIDVAGRDAWLSIFASFPLGLLFAWTLYRLRLRHPELHGAKLITAILGKPLGLFLNILFISYFLFLTTLSYAFLIDLIYVAFLPETPLWALIFFFLIFFLYATIKGIKRIALTAGVLTFIGVLTGHTVTLMDSHMKDWNRLFPLFEFGFSPFLLGTVVLTSIWVELLMLFFLPVQDMREKRMFLLWGIAIFLNGVMMLSTTTGTITIFGVGQADNFVYPALEIVRIISLGFIDRFDVYGLILMTFGCYIRCALFMRIAYDISASTISSKWLNWGLFASLLLLVLVGTFYLAYEHLRLERLLYVYAHLVLLFPLPFLLLGISYFKKKKNKQSQAQG